MSVAAVAANAGATDPPAARVPGVGRTAGDSKSNRHRVVVVGDSVILGARDQLAARYSDAGWDATLDMAVSRSTTAGLAAIESHRALLTDSLVIALGANDSGNTDLFRQRVARVMEAVSTVPHVYWVTIADARPYYAAANQVMRDAAAFHPNLTVIDWAAYAGTNSSVAGSDGLHLTPSGAAEMANLILFSTIASPMVVAPTSTSTTSTSTTTTSSTTTTKTAAVSPAPVDKDVPGVMERVGRSSEHKTSAAVTSGGSRTENRDGAGGAARFSVVLVALGVIGVALGTWSLKSARRRRQT